MSLLIRCLSEDATVPKRSSDGAAGYDLHSARNITIPKRQRRLVKTDISMTCPDGTYGRIAPRSGLAYKKGIDVAAGVIDKDYTGPVGVLLYNTSNIDFVVSKGDRIAQLIMEKIELPTIKVVDELEETNRGSGGFGSTGV